MNEGAGWGRASGGNRRPRTSTPGAAAAPAAAVPCDWGGRRGGPGVPRSRRAGLGARGGLGARQAGPARGRSAPRRAPACCGCAGASVASSRWPRAFRARAAAFAPPPPPPLASCACSGNRRAIAVPARIAWSPGALRRPQNRELESPGAWCGRCSPPRPQQGRLAPSLARPSSAARPPAVRCAVAAATARRSPLTAPLAPPWLQAWRDARPRRRSSRHAWRCCWLRACWASAAGC